MSEDDRTDDADWKVNAPPPENRIGLQFNGKLMATGPIAALKKLRTNVFDGVGQLVRMPRGRRRQRSNELVGSQPEPVQTTEVEDVETEE